MSQEVIEITEREIEVIEVVEKGPLGPVGPVGPQANINYTVVTANQTLTNSQNIAADTSGGSFTLTLPANPNAGDSIDIFDYANTFDTNPLTIARNGQNIESLAENLTANVEGAYFTLIYTGATRGWQILPRYGVSGIEDVLSAQGDLLYRGASSETRLPIGTAGQVLKVNSGATAPEWGSISGSISVTGSDLTLSGATGTAITNATLATTGVSAGTYTKVTVDTKGRVTTGATATPSDVGLGNVSNTAQVTSVTGTAPIVSSGGTTPAISISAATTGAAGSMSSADKTKLDGIAAGAEVNVQSNWTEANSGSDAFILNKPTLGTAAAQDTSAFAAASHTHDAADVTTGTFDNARINFAAPSSIGSTTPAAGSFTTLKTNNIGRGAYTSIEINSTGGLTLIPQYADTNGRLVSIDANTWRYSANGLIAEFGRNYGRTQSFFLADEFIFGRTANPSTINTGIVVLTRDADHVLAQRLGTNAQTFNIYNTFTSSTNHERGFLRWSSNVFQIGTEKGSGGGTARALEFQTDGVTRFALSTAGVATFTATNTLTITPNTTSTLVGGAAAVRLDAVRLAFATGGTDRLCFTGGGDLQFGATLIWNWLQRTRFSSPADGQFLIQNSAGTDFGRIQLGGTTSSFPSIKRDSTAIHIRLADDSAFAPLSCGALTLNGNLDASTRNIVTDTTTGTRIGTGATQLLGFWNATPVDQPALTADLLDSLQEVGLIASGSGNTPLNLTGGTLTAGNLVLTDNTGSETATFDAQGKLSTNQTYNLPDASGTLALTSDTTKNLWIPASAWIPKTTAGCGVDSRETTTNDQNFDELLFDAGSDEFADALVVMPSNYNNGTITARFYWTAASGSGGVAWAIQGRAFANDDALDTAAGTAQLVTDTLIAANDMHVTSATSACTIGGTPASGTPIQFTIYRDVSDAADDLAVDARLLGVEIIFN